MTSMMTSGSVQAQRQAGRRQAAGQKMYGGGFQQANANPGGMSRFQDTATPHRMAANRASPNRGTMGMGNPPSFGAAQRNMLGSRTMNMFASPGQASGPQGMNPGMGSVGVTSRFRPSAGVPTPRTSPFQGFQNNWGPRTAGFQASGVQRRPPPFNRGLQTKGALTANPNFNKMAFSAMQPPSGPGRFNTFKR